MKTILLILFAIFMISGITSGQTPPIETGVSQALAKWRKANYSDVRYKLNITLEKGAPLMKGTIEVSINLSVPPALAGGSTPAIILDWRKIKDKENLSTVSNVFLNGKSATLAPPANAGGTDLRYKETNEHLVFTDGVKAGENVVKLDFTSPIATSGAAVTRYVDKEDGAEYVYSLFVPSDASTAFPVFDQPDLKARFQLNLAVSENWKVVSNTRVKESGVTHFGSYPNSSEKGERRVGGFYVFEETQPISTYVFAFAAGDFAVFDDVENSAFKKLTVLPGGDGELVNSSLPKIYVRKSQAEKFKQHAAEVFRLNRENNKSKSAKLDIVLLPETSIVPTDFEGLKFMRESSVFR